MAARVTQGAVEVLALPDTAKARVTQEAVEALVLPDNQKARITQLCIEVLLPSYSAPTGRKYGPAIQTM
jgi:hypothetical protein